MSLSSLPVVILGLRAEESDDRAKMAKVEQKDRFTEFGPFTASLSASAPG